MIYCKNVLKILWIYYFSCGIFIFSYNWLTIVLFFIGGIMLLEHRRNCTYGNCRGDMDMVMVLSLALSAIYIYDGENRLLKGCALFIPRNLRKKNRSKFYCFFTRFRESKNRYFHSDFRVTYIYLSYK